MYKDIQENTNITQSMGNPQNSGRQNGFKKQELYRGSTDNYAPPLHSSVAWATRRPGALAPRVFAPKICGK